MGGGDYEKSKIRSYIGNNYGLGANNFGGTVPEGNSYGLGSNTFRGNVQINFPEGRVHYVPMIGTSVPPPPPPPPDTEIEYYIGNNFGFTGFDFAQPYTISSVQNDNKQSSPSPLDLPLRIPNTSVSPLDKNPPQLAPSRYATPTGVIETLCPACKSRSLHRRYKSL